MSEICDVLSNTFQELKNEIYTWYLWRDYTIWQIFINNYVISTFVGANCPWKLISHISFYQATYQRQHHLSLLNQHWRESSNRGGINSASTLFYAIHPFVFPAAIHPSEQPFPSVNQPSHPFIHSSDYPGQPPELMNDISSSFYVLCSGSVTLLPPCLQPLLANDSVDNKSVWGMQEEIYGPELEILQKKSKLMLEKKIIQETNAKMFLVRFALSHTHTHLFPMWLMKLLKQRRKHLKIT